MQRDYQDRFTLVYLTSGVFVLTMIAGLILSCSNYAFADSEVDEVVVAVPSSCTFELGGGGTYNVELDNNDSEVVTANDITVSCNDASGYAIYAIGFSDDSYGNTDLISTTNTDYNIKTDGTGNYGSSWKMKLAAVSNAAIEGSYSSAWQNIPATYVKVASFNTNTTTGIITPSYQINVSATQIAGTYTGKVKYTLVHPNTAPAPMMPLDPSLAPQNSIVYAPNASDIIGSMDSISNTKITSSPTAGVRSATANSTATLIAPNYSRDGYGFAGWSTDFEATSSSKIYGPNETVSTNPNDEGGLNVSNSNHGAILYPVWIAKETNVTMQTFNSTNYSSAPNGTVIALEDERDHDVYAVAKLADGKWWMIENLRLNAEDTTSSTNIAKAQGYYTYPGTGTNYGSFIGLADSEDANFNSTAPTAAKNATNSLYSSDGSGNTININSSSSPAYRIPRYNNNNTNMATNATNSAGTTLTDSYNGNNDHARWYGYGNYYNWPAAIANTGYYSGDNYQVENTSICPTGWALPEGGSVTTTHNVTGDTTTFSDFYNLGYAIMGTVANDSQPNNGNAYYDNTPTNTAGDTATKAFRKFPNNFVYSGRFSGASADYRGSYGDYWSRSAGVSDYAYLLYLSSSNVYPGTINGSKNYGSTVRCIAQ